MKIPVVKAAAFVVNAIILPAPGPNPIIGASQVGLGQTNVIYSVNYQPGSTYAGPFLPA